MAIFEDDELAADAVTADTPAEQVEETVEAAQQRARDEQGRFAKTDDAPAGEEPADQPEGEQQQRQVPQGALHAERERRKEAEGKWKQAQAQLDAIAQMRAQIAAQRPEPVTPPANEDPASETAYLRQRLEQIEGAQTAMAQRDQLSQVDMAERQQLGSVLTQSEAEYRSVKPDYDAAINHVVNARAQELALYGLSPLQVQETLQQEVLDITKAAIQQGRAPAEVAYQLATLRGYRPEAGQSAAPQPGQAQRQLEAVGAARATSRSLGQAAGTGVTKELNAAAIANMPIEEFDALYSTPEGRRMIDAL